jgi:hypothetical protein
VHEQRTLLVNCALVAPLDDAPRGGSAVLLEGERTAAVGGRA